jgi:ligand-binding SRPBCC domain-containing protein
VQAAGLYRFWRHEHTFEPVDGATLMRDRVEYELPLGLGGTIAQKDQLRRIFDYPERVVRRAFGDGSDNSLLHNLNRHLFGAHRLF